MLNRSLPVRVFIYNRGQNLAQMIAIRIPHVGSQDFRTTISLNSILDVLGVEGKIRLGSSDSGQQVIPLNCNSNTYIYKTFYIRTCANIN